jgi:adenylate cyclase
VERAALRLYLPAQVVEAIESEGGTQLGGLLQPVTVVFADIRGFTRLSERMDAREVVQLLNEFFTASTDVVVEAGGVLDKFIGDCVMALFGAPSPSPNDALRAVQAAANMQRAAAKLSTNRLERGLRGIEIGVGIHTGLAVVGNIGSAQRMQYTAIGDTVNVAARLVSRAAGGEIVVSDDVRSAAGDSFAFTPLGEVELKGRTQKIGIHALRWS